MNIRCLPRLLRSIHVWSAALLALGVTGCMTVTNHYYTTTAPSTTPGVAQTSSAPGDCPCDGAYRTTDYVRQYHAGNPPCSDYRRGYEDGYRDRVSYRYPQEYPLYYPYIAPTYRWWERDPGRGTSSDVSENPPSIGGVPATERRHDGGTIGGRLPRRPEDGIGAPPTPDVQKGPPVNRDAARSPEDGVDAPYDRDVHAGGDAHPRRTEDDVDAPTTGPVRAEGRVGERPGRRNDGDVIIPSTDVPDVQPANRHRSEPIPPVATPHAGDPRRDAPGVDRDDTPSRPRVTAPAGGDQPQPIPAAERASQRSESNRSTPVSVRRDRSTQPTEKGNPVANEAGTPAEPLERRATPATKNDNEHTSPSAGSATSTTSGETSSTTSDTGPTNGRRQEDAVVPTTASPATATPRRASGDQ